jgi:hypothetical protein
MSPCLSASAHLSIHSHTKMFEYNPRNTATWPRWCEEQGWTSARGPKSNDDGQISIICCGNGGRYTCQLGPQLLTGQTRCGSCPHDFCGNCDKIKTPRSKSSKRQTIDQYRGPGNHFRLHEQSQSPSRPAVVGPSDLGLVPQDDFFSAGSRQQKHGMKNYTTVYSCCNCSEGGCVKGVSEVCVVCNHVWCSECTEETK